jgi:hypothetical protein
MKKARISFNSLQIAVKLESSVDTVAENSNIRKFEMKTIFF